MKFSEAEIRDCKRTHFVFSGTLYDGGDDFNLWRLYGQNGNGVAIVFELEEIYGKWNGFHAVGVSYDSDEGNAKKIIDYIAFHKEFNEKYHLFENTPSEFLFLALQIKNRIWSIENEFRLIAHCPFDKYSLKPKEHGLTYNPLLSKTIEHSVSRNGEPVSYVQLPLYLDDKHSGTVKSPFRDEDINLADYVPRMTIKEVVLGYNIQGRHLGALEDFLLKILPIKLGYSIKISRSKIFN